jgi:hypothetical protein
MATIRDLIVKIGADVNDLKRGLNKGKQEVSSFGKTVNKLGGLIAGAFAVSKITAFGKEVISLAGEAEGVRNAFQRIADQNTLEELKEATRGTTSELELMKRTVMASNLGIPVKNLATLFEFASRRAQQTGESVERLVEQLVVGLGRKSVLRLDDLGITSDRIKDKMGGISIEAANAQQMTEAFTKIAIEEMDKMGEAIVTTKDAQEQLNSAWADLKVTIGDKLAPVARLFFEDSAKGINQINTLIETETLKWWEKLVGVIVGASSGTLPTFLDNVEKANNEAKETSFNWGEIDKSIKSVNSSLDKTNEKIKEIKAPEFRLGELGDVDISGVTELWDDAAEIDSFFKSIGNGVGEIDKVKLGLDSVTSSAMDFFTTMQMGSMESIRSLSDFANSVLNTAKQVIAANLAMSISKAILGEMGKGLLGLITAGIAVGGVKALFSAIPSFAQGGMVTQPTLAMIGDNPGRKEAVIPSEMFGKIGGQQRLPQLAVRGKDLYWVNKRYSEYLDRSV